MNADQAIRAPLFTRSKSTFAADTYIPILDLSEVNKEVSHGYKKIKSRHMEKREAE